MSNIKQIKQVSIKDNKLKATIEVYNERTADSYQTSYQNECPIHEEFTLAMANLNFHVEKICGTCFPGLRAEGFYRQPSGDSELLTIYAVPTITPAPSTSPPDSTSGVTSTHG